MRPMKICKNCRPMKKFPWGYRFCPYCGKLLEQQEMDLKDAVRTWTKDGHPTDAYFGREFENKHPDTDRLM